jgi:DMSO/TMAO reductase YedYZ heme-binding membrane subunit
MTTGRANELSVSKEISGQKPDDAVSIIMKPGFQARLNGLLAFFFAGLTLIVGIFRRQLMNKLDRKIVIRYHTLVGFFALLFMVLHIASVLFDVGGWGDSVKLVNVFFPDFSSLTMTYISLGAIGMYLLLITILTGIFFLKISKRFGYLTWVTLHRGSFFFYAFIFFHALKIGTDFHNPYIIIFFWQVFAVVGIYLIYLIAKTKAVSAFLRNALVRSGLIRVTVGEILESPQDYVGKMIITSGNIMKAKHEGGWYTITGQEKTMYARMPEGFPAGIFSRIRGKISKLENTLFIEIVKLKE